jgi:hypothetical protein
MKSQYDYVWIFAFADLAFLLLIAFTQVASSNSNICYEMNVPKVSGDINPQPVSQAAEYYELRVLSSDEKSSKPFQLVYIKGSKADSSEPMNSEDLKLQLGDLKKKGKKRPILSADERSFSKDAFLALSLIEAEWKARMAGVIPGIKKD